MRSWRGSTSSSSSSRTALHHELTAEHDGGRLGVAVGDTIAVSLAETPTTGYRWEPDVDEGALRVMASEAATPTTPPGAPGERVIRFEVVGPGPTRLRLVRKRSWEDAVKEQFVVDLHADAA